MHSAQIEPSDAVPSFHEGERAMQEQAGVGDRLAQIGRQFIRGYMPDQHRDFFAQLPFVIAGSVDAQEIGRASCRERVCQYV